MEWVLTLLAALSALFSVPYVGNSLSYVALREPTISTPSKATILFGGDMMFDRSIRTAGETHGEDYLLSCLDPLLAPQDLVVANLEGPITMNPSVSVGTLPPDLNNFTFTFPSTTAELLFRHNIRLVNLGNNHIMNFSREGLLQTIEFLDSAGVGHFGDPDKSESDRVERRDINGIRFSFVSWSDWTSDKTDHTVAQVRAEKDAGRTVIVYTHWGDEYVPPPERVIQLAHSFVDAGASIVIGSHPHVVLEREMYNGVSIYYSLGNLIFDQYWEPAVRNGMMLEVRFSNSKIESIKEIPVEMLRDRRTCVVE